MNIDISLRLLCGILLIIISQCLLYASLQYDPLQSDSQFNASCILLVLGWVITLTARERDIQLIITSVVICLSQIMLMYSDKQFAQLLRRGFAQDQQAAPRISLGNSDVSVLVYIVGLLYFAYMLNPTMIGINMTIALGLLVSSLIFVRHQRLMGITDGVSYILITILWVGLLSNKSHVN